MANQEQLAILKQGVEVWNKWREENPKAEINLNRADLREANLSGIELWEADLAFADLRNADLSKAQLVKAKLMGAKLAGCVLRKTNLEGVDFREANLSGADLREAYLNKANLGAADLREADLTGASLVLVTLVGTKIDKAKISGSSVFGINVWDIKGEFQDQNNLIITPIRNLPIVSGFIYDDEIPIITVDNIKVAQFIYLILSNEEIRDVINTFTSKSVLILGRFALPERKDVLDALRNKLREYNLLPIVFDFDRPTDKDFTETIKTLAGLSYFVIADVTNPKSSPLELQATVPDYQIPFVPIIQEGELPFAMMVDLQKKYSWVLPTVTYDSMETLIKILKPLIIDPAMKKRQELRIIKAQVPEVISGKDYLEKDKA